MGYKSTKLHELWKVDLDNRTDRVLYLGESSEGFSIQTVESTVPTNFTSVAGLEPEDVIKIAMKMMELAINQTKSPQRTLNEILKTLMGNLLDFYGEEDLQPEGEIL